MDRALFIARDQVSDDLDEAIAGGLAVRVAVVSGPVHQTRVFCDRDCGSLARYAGLGGAWCCGCWSRRKKWAEPIVDECARLLALRYGLRACDAPQLVESLADAGGFVRIRASSAPPATLRYHPHPRALIGAILDGPHQRIDLQLGTIARALWGLALMWGEDLHGYPRDGHPSPDEIPWGVVRWAESDLRAYRWLLRAAMELRAARHALHGRDCAASAQITWLLENTHAPAIRAGSHPLPPPAGVLVERVAVAA